MGWLLELLFESVSEMCSKFIVDMMDVASGMFTEILSCNLDLFEELFGVAGDLYKNAIVPMGVALLWMILVWQLFKSMFGKLGTASENPVELVFRSCFCLFMILFAKDIVNYILEVARTPYDWVVGTTITVDSFSEYVNTTEGVMSVLGIDVMTISVLKLLLQLVVAWNYFKMLFILAERYVLLGIFSYTSPLAFASGGSKATNNVLSSWTKMFGGQVLVVILDAWCVKMFLSAYGNMMASSYGFTKFFAANMCLIGFCKITAKLDSYMGSLGVNLGRIGGGMSGLGALLMAGRLMNFGSGRKSASGGGSGGHMNFGSGKTIPLGNGEPGVAGGTVPGGAGQPGSGIGGLGADSFEGQAPEFMGNGENPGETTGFGDFGGDMEPAKEENLPFGMPEEDSEMSMGPEGGEMEFGDNGVEDGPFGTVMDMEEEMSGDMNFAGGQESTDVFGQEMGAESMAPFGQEVEDGAVEPLGQGMSPGDMEPESGGISMEDINGMEGYAGMHGEDMALGGMFEAAEGMEGEIFGMSGEGFESGADMGSFGGSFAEGIEGFSDGMGDLEYREDGYGGAAMETGGMGYEAGGISGMEGVAEGGVLAGGIGVAGDSGSGREGFGNIGAGNAVGMENGFAAGGLENMGGITGGGTGSGSEFLVGSGSGQNTGNASGMAYKAENGMAGSLASGAGNMDREAHGMSGMESYGVGVPGVYRMERDGEGYMRYDASRYERPRGEYQTIHENGKTFYELPETAKAPGILPETRVSLERDGTLKLEKIYRERRSMPVEQMQRQEPGKSVQGSDFGKGVQRQDIGNGTRREGYGKPESDGKQKVKQKRNGQGIAGSKGQSGKGHGQWKGDGRK